MASFTWRSMNNRRNTAKTRGNVGNICVTAASWPVQGGLRELTAAQGAFPRGRSQKTRSSLALNFKAGRGDPPGSGLGEWRHCNFRHKLSSVPCLGETQPVRGEDGLARREMGRAGRNTFELQISVSCWGLKEKPIPSRPFANGETKAQRKKMAHSRPRSRPVIFPGCTTSPGF